MAPFSEKWERRSLLLRLLTMDLKDLLESSWGMADMGVGKPKSPIKDSISAGSKVGRAAALLVSLALFPLAFFSNDCHLLRFVLEGLLDLTGEANMVDPAKDKSSFSNDEVNFEKCFSSPNENLRKSVLGAIKLLPLVSSAQFGLGELFPDLKLLIEGELLLLERRACRWLQ